MWQHSLLPCPGSIQHSFSFNVKAHHAHRQNLMFVMIFVETLGAGNHCGACREAVPQRAQRQALPANPTPHHPPCFFFLCPGCGKKSGRFMGFSHAQHILPQLQEKIWGGVGGVRPVAPKRTGSIAENTTPQGLTGEIDMWLTGLHARIAILSGTTNASAGSSMRPEGLSGAKRMPQRN